MKISVIFPVRNEEKLIEKVVLDTYNYLKKREKRFEILVVGNGCNDTTEDIVRRLQTTFREIRLLNSKIGYGWALRTGLKKARGKYVAIFNVDFYDKRFLDFYSIDLLGKDLIIGSKLANWAKDSRPLNRHVISIIFNILLKVLFGYSGSDTHGIKILRNNISRKILPKCKTTSGIFDTELVIRIQRAGFEIIEYPVRVKEVRPSRFSRRVIQTPADLYNLYNSLKEER